MKNETAPSTIAAPPALAEIRAGAETAVQALDQLALGEPFASAVATALAALNALEAAAARPVFPLIVTPQPGHLLMLDAVADVVPRAEQPAHFAELHQAALVSALDFADFLRSDVAVRRIAGGAAPFGAHGAERENLEREALDEYRLAVAVQLVDDPALGSAAAILARILPALDRRFLEAKTRHEEHAQAALAELERKRLEANEQIAARARERVASVVAFFGPRAGLSYLVGDRLFSGAGLVALAQRSAVVYDGITGEAAGPLSIEDLEAAMRRAAAAEAAQ